MTTMTVIPIHNHRDLWGWYVADSDPFSLLRCYAVEIASDVAEWFNQNVITYECWYDPDIDEVCITFDNENDAAIFKLRWM